MPHDREIRRGCAIGDRRNDAGRYECEGANRRMCRSHCASRLAISGKEAIQPRRLSSIQALALTIAAQSIAAFGRHRRFRGGRMNDTLHGGEAWSRPCQRDRGGRDLGASGISMPGFQFEPKPRWWERGALPAPEVARLRARHAVQSGRDPRWGSDSRLRAQGWQDRSRR